MKTRIAAVGLATVLCLWVAGAGATGPSAKEMPGEVTETGVGRFVIRGQGGAHWMFHLSRADTRFEPADWRPVVGDEVRVSFFETLRRNTPISQALVVTLVEPGPATLRITSPIEVEIIHAGRSGFKARLIPSGVPVRFLRYRGTQVLPTGWVPSRGDRVRITFTAKPGSGFGINYHAHTVELVTAPDPADAGD